MQRGLDVVQRIVQFPQLDWELDMLVMPGFQRQLQRLQEQRILEKTPADSSAILRKTQKPRDHTEPFVFSNRLFFAHGDDRCPPLHGLGVQPGHFGQHLLGGNASGMQWEVPCGSTS